MQHPIRLAGSADVGHIADLVQQYWEFEAIAGFDRKRITEHLTRLLVQPHLAGCWVAEDLGTPVAYLLVVYMFSLEYGGPIAEIDELFVAASHRSQGLGAALLEAAEREMAKAGILRVQLQLSPANTRGRQFYAQRQYQRRAFELLDKDLVNPSSFMRD